MQSTAAQYFGAMAADYDSLIRRAVPRYDELLERLLAYLPERAERVLELGCGTGNLTLGLAARYPQAELLLVDASAEMLAVASARLGDRPGVRCVESTFEQLELPPGCCDVLASSVSLHHVVDKAALFRALHRWLRPGGALGIADQMGGAIERNHRLNWGGMVDHWRLPGNLTAAEQQSLVEHAAVHDHYAPVVEQIHQLEQAGFGQLDCVWRNWMWAVLTARA